MKGDKRALSLCAVSDADPITVGLTDRAALLGQEDFPRATGDLLKGIVAVRILLRERRELPAL